MEVNHGFTIGKLAKKGLEPGFEHSMVVATHYMFPAADKHRIALIAALMIVFFVFDGHSLSNPPSTPLQSHLDDIVRGIEFEDSAGGTGGKEMLDELRNAFRCVHPNEFKNVEDYLEFRRYNVGAWFVIAAAKFSVKSAVPLDLPRYSRFLMLFCNHLSLVNDLASYDKEVHAFEQGTVGGMINLVDAVKKATSLQSTEDAKGVVWMLQLQLEKQMMNEFDILQAQGLRDEDRWFLEAVIAAAVGNVLYSATTSRYGGEAAKLGKSRKTSELLA
ncbi:MAG: hypothetical protein Q9202_002366 [Teloschistes flavicans]